MTYDPNLGRWLEEDPEGFNAGDMNLYRIEGNNPTNEVDPSGLFGIFTISFTQWKQLARLNWREFAWAIEWKYPLTSTLLLHSLQDNPPVLEFGVNNPLTKAMRNSPEFAKLAMRVCKSAPVGKIGPVVKGIVFEQNRDLWASVHEAEVTIKGGKKIDDQNFELTVTFADTYNYEFHYMDMMLSYGKKDYFRLAGWMANNTAWMSEISGVISPYQWYTEPITIVVKGGKIQ